MHAQQKDVKLHTHTRAHAHAHIFWLRHRKTCVHTCTLEVHTSISRSTCYCLPSTLNCITYSSDSTGRFNAETTADCWVLNVDIPRSLRRCLLQFEAQGGMVDWKAFDAKVKMPKHNPSTHADCGHYFNSSMQETVMRHNYFLASTYRHAMQQYTGIALGPLPTCCA